MSWVIPAKRPRRVRLELNHRALHLALEKLGLPAQELGILFHGLFNPATVAIVGLTAAWQIWNNRVEEGVKILSGMSLPDLSTTDRPCLTGARGSRCLQQIIVERGGELQFPRSRFGSRH